MSYTRVLPRDLFNEAKLLKCIGRLVLLIHDRQAPEGLNFYHDGRAFDIHQDESDGSIFVTNVEFFMGDQFDENKLHFFTTLNSKAPYPLYLNVNDEEAQVFTDAGDLTPEFLNLLKSI